MNGCRRPPTMTMPLIAPTISPTQGVTSSTPSTPNLVSTWGSSTASAAPAPTSPTTAGTARPRTRRRTRLGARPRLRALAEQEPGRRRQHDEDRDRRGRKSHRGGRRPALHGQEHGADHGAERHDRADREIDAGGDDHRGHPRGDQAGDRHLPQDVEQVAVGQEDVVALGADRRGQHADQEDRRQPPVELGAREEPKQRHDAMRHGSARRGEVHDRFLAGLRARQHPGPPALRDDHDPVREQQQLRQLRAHHHDRQPLARQRAHQVVDLLLGADVDAAGRLVEQEHPRPGGQPLADDHLLLVAAGERRRDLLDAGAAHPEATHRLGRHLRLAAGGADAEAREARQRRQRDIVADRRLQMQPLGLAVLGHERDAEPPRVPRRAHLDRHALDPDGTAAPSRAGAEQRLEDLRAARAQQAGDPQHLAGADLEADAVEHPVPAAADGHLQREPAHLEHRLAAARSAGAGAGDGLAPDHRRDHPVAVHLGDRRGHHVPAVAQHRDPVRQRATSSSRCEM